MFSSVTEKKNLTSFKEETEIEIFAISRKTYSEYSFKNNYAKVPLPCHYHDCALIIIISSFVALLVNNIRTSFIFECIVSSF